MNYEEHWQTDKSMNMWAKKIRKELTGRYLDLFGQQFAQMSKSNHYTKASFVMYWEILMIMADKFLQLNKMQEANAVHMMLVNFTRLIGGLDEEE